MKRNPTILAKVLILGRIDPRAPPSNFWVCMGTKFSDSNPILSGSTQSHFPLSISKSKFKTNSS